jgi:hypothetical protein
LKLVKIHGLGRDSIAPNECTNYDAEAILVDYAFIKCLVDATSGGPALRLSIRLLLVTMGFLILLRRLHGILGAIVG